MTCPGPLGQKETKMKKHRTLFHSRSRQRRTRGAMLALGALGLTLFLAAPAAAGPSFSIGLGGSPRIAMSGTTAHIVWLRQTATGNEIRYCRLPQGAQTCSATKTFPAVNNLNDWSPPFVLTQQGSNRVVIVSSHSGVNTAVAFVSNDGGTTFPNVGKELGDLYLGELGAAAREASGSGISLLGDGDPATVSYQRGNLSGPKVFAEAALETDLAYQYSYALAIHDDVQIAAYSSTNDTKFSYYKGSGDIHNAANWSGPHQTPAPGGSEADLVEGPAGVYLMRNTLGHPGGGHYDVSKFTGTGFAPPRAVPGSGASNHDADLFQDGTGRLHVIYNVLMGSGVTALRYTSSGDGGVTWTPLGDVIRETNVSDNFAVAASGAGEGLAVWATSPNDNGTIKVALLDSLIPVAGAGPAPSPSPLPSADTTPPGVGGLALGDGTLTPGQGTTFSFTSSESGSARLVFERAGKGLKLRKRGQPRRTCMRQTKRRVRQLRRTLARSAAVRSLSGRARSRKLARLVRKRRCTAWKSVGSITQVVSPGRNEIRFGGKLAGRNLAPGRYRAHLTVRDLAGNVSARRTIGFRVVRR